MDQSLSQPRIRDDSNEGVLAARITLRKQYDITLPALDLPKRSRLRLTLDLIIAIPLLLILWGLDELRLLPARIASVFHRTAVGNRQEKCRKKHEASQQREGEAG